MLEPTLEHATHHGLLCDIETIWLDRGYDSEATRLRLRDLGIDERRHCQEAQPRHPLHGEEASDGFALAGRTDQLVALKLRRTAA